VTQTDRDRNRDTGGQLQGHRWTGTGTQIDRNTDRQGQTWTGTQMDRGRDTDRQGQGHQGTGKGSQTDMDRDTDTDIDNFNGQLTKKQELKALSFKKFYKIKF
jgi:hypothetical protein